MEQPKTPVAFSTIQIYSWASLTIRSLFISNSSQAPNPLSISALTWMPFSSKDFRESKKKKSLFQEKHQILPELRATITLQMCLSQESAKTRCLATWISNSRLRRTTKDKISLNRLITLTDRALAALTSPREAMEIRCRASRRTQPSIPTTLASTTPSWWVPLWVKTNTSPPIRLLLSPTGSLWTWIPIRTKRTVLAQSFPPTKTRQRFSTETDRRTRAKC